jgi:hypothetical protein
MAHAQSERSEVTFSGGTAIQFDVPLSSTATPVSLGGTYSYRLYRHLALEAGVLTAIHPTGPIRGYNYDIDPKDLFTWVQFGPRVVLPVWEGRLELSAGAGGAYENYSIGSDASGFLSPRSGWGGNFSAGAAVALDHGRHFWLGTTPRWILVNTGAAHDRWFVAGGEFSFRF